MSGIGYLSGAISFASRILVLPVNTFITVRDPSTSREVKLQVVSAEKLYPLRQYAGSPEWKPSGDEWPTLLCVSGDKTWTKSQVLLTILGTNQYMFNKRVPLGPEGAVGIAPYAQKFGHSNGTLPPIPGSVSMPYGGREYKIQDIGVWGVKSKTGESHIPSGDIARFVIAHGQDGLAILVEDAKNGSEYDTVWEGWLCNFESVVRDVLTPDGE